MARKVRAWKRRQADAGRASGVRQQDAPQWDVLGDAER